MAWELLTEKKERLKARIALKTAIPLLSNGLTAKGRILAL
jgi:hypothetical protein